MKLLRVLRETFLASLPLAAAIVAICCFVAPVPEPYDYVKLAVGYIGVVVGQSLFLVGLDVSVLPIGRAVGESLVKLKKVIFIVFFGFLFGFLAEAAEPSLAVFARQTHLVMNEISERVLIWVMAGGIGALVGAAMFRILKDINIKAVFAALYAAIFFLAVFTPAEFVGIAFDGSGATTGDISVPFMLAIGIGVSATMSRRKTNEDTFGIIGMASAGPILAVFIYGIVFRALHGGTLPPAGEYSPGAAESFGEVTAYNLGGIAMALLPILLVFITFQFFLIRLFKKDFIKILLGIVPVFAGLLIFLSCVDFGFAFAGKYIGEVFLDLSRPGWFKWLLLPVGFVLGGAITLSEPAVTVLGSQLEEITNGHIKKTTIRVTLAIGLGFAAALSIVKILTQVGILWFLVPMYAVALAMMIPSQKLFVGLAFDSGGVTAGALTSAFLTPLTLGIAQAVARTAGEGAQSILINGFGIIAFMSAVPLIAVQTLGLIYMVRQKRLQKTAEAHELEELLPRGESADGGDGNGGIGYGQS